MACPCACSAHSALTNDDTSSHPFRNELTSDPLQQKGGWVEIPQKPGLGIDVNRNILEKYAA